MSKIISKHPIISYAENTAFTSLLVGVFLNSPMISKQDIQEIQNQQPLEYYGNRFQYSLNAFSQQRPMKQLQILHSLQRYVFLS